MVDCHRLLGKTRPSLDPAQAELVEMVGFINFHLLSRVMDVDPTSIADKDRYMQNPAWIYFTLNTMSVEILKGNQLQRIYFKVTDRSILRKPVKERLKWEV